MTTRFALTTIAHRDQSLAAFQIGDHFWPLAECSEKLGDESLPSDLMRVIDGWRLHLPALKSVAEACAHGQVDRSLAVQASKTQILAPLQYPQKVIGVGANYADHVAKVMPVLEAMGIPPPSGPHNRPIFFFKPASTALVGPGKTVKIPIGCKQFDWEIELAVIMGERLRDVSEGNALAAVAAYSVGLDMSARDLHLVPQSLFKFDAFAGKGHDTCCPLGPVLVPAEFIPDPQNLQMKLSINGETKQDASTAGMVYPVAQLISHVSRIVTLEPGDVILTGTPAGVGLETGEYLKVGDQIDAEIEHIGNLRVEIQPS